MAMSKDRVSFRLPYSYFKRAAILNVIQDAFNLTQQEALEAKREAGKYDQGGWGNAAQYYGYVHFICRPSQFARFIILRNDAGLKNGFKELHPKLIPAPPPVASPIDVSTRSAR